MFYRNVYMYIYIYAKLVCIGMFEASGHKTTCGDTQGFVVSGFRVYGSACSQS